MTLRQIITKVIMEKAIIGRKNEIARMEFITTNMHAR